MPLELRRYHVRFIARGRVVCLIFRARHGGERLATRFGSPPARPSFPRADRVHAIATELSDDL